LRREHEKEQKFSIKAFWSWSLYMLRILAFKNDHFLHQFDLEHTHSSFIQLFIEIVGGGVHTGSARHCGHVLAYCPCPGWLWGWRSWWNEVLGENLPRRHFVHHKSHLPDPGANSGCSGGKPATNRFSIYTGYLVSFVRTLKSGRLLRAERMFRAGKETVNLDARFEFLEDFNTTIHPRIQTFPNECARSVRKPSGKGTFRRLSGGRLFV
jgi:hypothetical protein